jgi:hypothetical protein
MPSKQLSKAAAEPTTENGAIQVETTLPVRPRRHEGGNGGRPAFVFDAGSQPRVPRVTRLMALAIKFQDMVDQREVRDYADLARLGFVTRARLTQIMNLLLLAPDIQELLLLSPGATDERRLRAITRLIEWEQQRRLFRLSFADLS